MATRSKKTQTVLPLSSEEEDFEASRATEAALIAADIAIQAAIDAVTPPSTALTVLESVTPEGCGVIPGRDFEAEADAAAIASYKAKRDSDERDSDYVTIIRAALKDEYGSDLQAAQTPRGHKFVEAFLDRIPPRITAMRLGVSLDEAIKIRGWGNPDSKKEEKRDATQELAYKNGTTHRTRLAGKLSKAGLWAGSGRSPSAPKGTGAGEGKGEKSSVPLGTILSLDDAKERIEKVREIIDGLFTETGAAKLMKANPQHFTALVNIEQALIAYIALPTKG